MILQQTGRSQDRYRTVWKKQKIRHKRKCVCVCVCDNLCFTDFCRQTTDPASCRVFIIRLRTHSCSHSHTHTHEDFFVRIFLLHHSKTQHTEYTRTSWEHQTNSHPFYFGTEARWRAFCYSGKFQKFLVFSLLLLLFENCETAADLLLVWPQWTELLWEKRWRQRENY